MLSGYDAVYDTIGGEVLEKSFQILKPYGKIVSISGLPNARFGREANLGWLKTTLLSIVSHKITTLEEKNQARYHFLFMKPSGRQLERIKDYLEEGLIKPVNDKIYDFKDVGQAFQYLEGGSAKREGYR